jgi:citrate lyase subunit beta/citryl-CoA lyase
MASCIHPNQVKVYNEIYGPSKVKTVRACKIVNAYDAALAAGQGATVDGVMIGVPVAGRSRALRAFADELAMLPAKL